MEVLGTGVDTDIFLKKLSRSRASALLLDYDGTLAPSFPDRDQAFPYPGVADMLKQIIVHGNTRLVIVSGRPANEVLRLIGLDGHRLEIRGSYGWERMTPGCPPEVIAKFRDTVTEEWLGLSRYAGLELCEFEGGLELRFPSRSKADAVEKIMGETEGEAAVAYPGDDASDEEAFRALKGKGLSALVRAEMYPTAADLWLKPPQGLLDFLWTREDLRSRAGLTHCKHA